MYSPYAGVAGMLALFRSYVLLSCFPYLCVCTAVLFSLSLCMYCCLVFLISMYVLLSCFPYLYVCTAVMFSLSLCMYCRLIFLISMYALLFCFPYLYVCTAVLFSFSLCMYCCLVFFILSNFFISSDQSVFVVHHNTIIMFILTRDEPKSYRNWSFLSNVKDQNFLVLIDWLIIA